MADEDRTMIIPEEEEEVRVFVEGLDDLPPEEPEAEVPKEFKEFTKAQLIEKIRANEQALSQATDSARSIKEAIAELGQTMRMQGQPLPAPVVPPPQPGESEAEYGERLKGELLEDPAKALNEHLRRSISPLISSVASGTRQIARELVRNQRGEATFDKYASEIDGIAAQAPIANLIQKPKEVYENAYNQVMAGHLDDLIAIRVAEEVAKMQTTGPGTASVKAPYGAPQGRLAPKQRNIILSQQEKEHADRKGLDYQTYAKIYKGA